MFSIPSDSHDISVFFPRQTLWRYTDGNLTNRGVECRWDRQKSRSLPISRCRIGDCWTCEQQLRRLTVQFTAQTATQQRILFITASMDDHDERNRTEQNLILRSGEPEAEVTNDRTLRSTYCTIEAN